MSSVQIDLPQGVWTQITDTDKNGEVLHLRGDSQAVYTEAAVIPTGYDVDTPTSRTTIMREGFTYYLMEATDYLWGYAITADVTITKTPAEV